MEHRLPGERAQCRQQLKPAAHRDRSGAEHRQQYDADRGPAEDCTRPVKTKTLAQIKRGEAGSWFGPRFAGQRIPTLEEVFQRYGRKANYSCSLTSFADAHGLQKPLATLAHRDQVARDL